MKVSVFIIDIILSLDPKAQYIPKGRTVRSTSKPTDLKICSQHKGLMPDTTSQSILAKG